MLYSCTNQPPFYLWRTIRKYAGVSAATTGSIRFIPLRLSSDYSCWSTEEPESEDYTGSRDDEPVFDAESYETAIQEYNAELTKCQQSLEAGKYQEALLERHGDDECCTGSHKSGNSHPWIIAGAIQRTLQREERAKQIDRDKVQLNVHRQFEEKNPDNKQQWELTGADLAAARLLAYQSLDYNGRRTVQETLFADEEKEEEDSNETFYEKLLSLTDQQYSYLIRTAIACKPESKYPHHETGFVLYKVAEAAGTD